jgi:hypothetical protein
METLPTELKTVIASSTDYNLEQLVRDNNIPLIQWLFASQADLVGCYDWSDLCYLAADVGNLELLQWARSKNVPWNRYTAEVATSNGHLEVLQWCLENGCEYDITSLMEIVNDYEPGNMSEGQSETFDWLYSEDSELYTEMNDEQYMEYCGCY